MDKNYPNIGSVISLDHVPEELNFLEDGIQSFLDEIFYSEFNVHHSADNISSSYYLKLVSYKDLKLGILGTGFSLVINPNYAPNPVVFFPINISYSLAARKYFKGVKLNEIQFSGNEILKFAKKIINLKKEDYLFSIATRIIDDPDPLNKVATDLNANYSFNISTPVNTDPFIAINEILTEIDNNNQDIFEILFNDYIFDSQNETLLKNLNTVFNIGFDQSIKEIIQQLFIPKISAELTMSLGIEIPRKVLIPMENVNGELILEEDDTIHSILAFEPSTLSFYAQSGFKFHKELAVSFLAPYEFAQIGNTGLTISVSKAKLDLAKNKNIAEATSDGRPPDFIGFYCEEVIIGLPEKWFKQDSGNSLGIVFRNFLAGTGGVSGKIGLEVIGSGSNPEMLFTLGKKPNSGTRKGFQIGFTHFHMVWQQNALIESSVKASFTIPKFKQLRKLDNNGNYDKTTGDLKINLDVFFEADGDFRLVFDPDFIPAVNGTAPTDLMFGFRDTFLIKIKQLEIGKDDDRVYVQISGALSFDNNGKLRKVIEKDLEVKKLRIYSDGSFELQGGTIPLPNSVAIPIGPAKISVTAIHFGSDTLNDREYKYFGFDGSVGLDPNGNKLSGNGLKYYFTVDDGPNKPHHSFFRIEGLGIKLTIPPLTTEESKIVLRLEGYLRLSEDFYEGEISFELPKANLAGSAAMSYTPSIPAFLIKVALGLPTPLPLANTGLGFFGFGGLFGLRYTADKGSHSTWYDYYKAPQIGVGINKFKTPDQTASAGNPFSIGAGAVLGTLPDDGKTFSTRIMFLLSLPNLILLEGRANVMGDRVKMDGGAEPPFYAALIFSPGDSVELGFGVDYHMPREGAKKGWIAKLQGELQAGYFFQDSNAWFFNVGTESKPVTARLLDLFSGYSYLMISPNGISAGAGIDFGFDKSYLGGTVKASVRVYMDVWAKISFPKKGESGSEEKTQLGAGIAVGGNVSAKVLGIGFFLSIDTILTGEVPRPFRVAGSVKLCVGVKILFKKIQKCFTVDFTWERDNTLNTTPIYALPSSSNAQKPSPAGAVHMLTGKTYELDYFGTNSNGTVTKDPIPLDCFIEIQFEKALIPNAVTSIGGVNNPASKYEDVVPPSNGRSVTHRYKLKSFELEIKNGSNWKSYHPYEAIVPAAQRGNVASFKTGYWQKTGSEYNKFRLLADSPFSYTQQGQAEWYIPERFGITPATLFCEGTHRSKICVNWQPFQFTKGAFYPYDQLGMTVNGDHTYSTNAGLRLRHPGKLEVIFATPTPKIDLVVRQSTAYEVKVDYLEEVVDPLSGLATGFSHVLTKVRRSDHLGVPIKYNIADHQKMIKKIIIYTPECDHEKINLLEEQLAGIIKQSKVPMGALIDFDKLIKLEKSKIIIEKSKCCLKYLDREERVILEYAKIDFLEQLEACKIKQVMLNRTVQSKCGNIIGTLGETPVPIDLIDDKIDTLPPIKEVKPLDLGKIPIDLSKDSLDLSKKPFNFDKEAFDLNKEPFDPNEEQPTDQNKKPLDAGKKPLGSSKGPIDFSKQFKISKVNPFKDTVKKILWKECQKARKAAKANKNLCKALEQLISDIDFLLSVNWIKPDSSICETSIHSLCWMKEEDYFYNEIIPGIDAIEADYALMQEAINSEHVPIWRPDSTYRIAMKVADVVNGNESSPRTVYAGFKTGSPLGHFGTGSQPPSNGNSLTPEETSGAEYMLKYYLDFEKCFPDANGALDGKPMYYLDPKINLFFNARYAHHFFQKWDAYQGLSGLDYSLDIQIKDPLEAIGNTGNSSAPDAIIVDQTNLPIADYFDPQNNTSVLYDQYGIPYEELSPEMQLLQNLENEIPNNCIQIAGGTVISPTQKYLTITARRLKPLKLYSVVVRNKNNLSLAAPEIHRYNFRTSAYGNFQEHIESYIIKDHFGNEEKAIFDLPLNLTTSLIADAWKIMQDQPVTIPPNTPDINTVYPDAFDRLIIGLWKIPPMHPATGTEFNFVKDSQSNNVRAILVRSNEPFIDPKTPLATTETMIDVIISGNVDNGFKKLFSADRAQVILMKTGAPISLNDLELKFKHLLWDGFAYTIADDFLVDLSS